MSTLEGLDLSEHRKTSMSDNYDVYHRIINNDELEMVLKVKTDTWIGVGWKPTGGQECRKGYLEGNVSELNIQLCEITNHSVLREFFYITCQRFI